MATTIKRITQNNVKYFANLIDPEVAEAIAAGAPITALGAFADGECKGAIAGAITEDHEFTIMSLYVAHSSRRQGIGTQLIDAVNDLLIPFEARIEIAYNELDSEKEVLTEFLLINGYEFDSAAGPAYYMSTLDKVLASEVIKKVSKGVKTNNIISFESASGRWLNAANERAEQAGAPVPDGGLNSDAVDKTISMAYVENDEIKAYVAIEKIEDNLLDIASVYDGKCGPAVLVALIKSAIEAAQKKYPGKTKIVSCAINDKSERLLEQVFDGNLISRKLYKRAEHLFTDLDIACMAAASIEDDKEPLVDLSEIPAGGDFSKYIDDSDEPDKDDIFAGIKYDPNASKDEDETVYIGHHHYEDDEEDDGDDDDDEADGE